MFRLNADDPEVLTQYLKLRKWLQPAENICAISIPGDGNMNYVIRIDTGQRTFILKQSRAYVEKYPHIPAPANRAIMEGKFYQTIKEHRPIQTLMPIFLGLDKTNNILAMEDLGMATDFTFLYRLTARLSSTDVKALTHYLNLLHAHFQQPKGSRKMANLKMRKLNHEHIFNYPFQEENGFNLDTIQPGLQALAMHYKTNTSLKRIVRELGKVYLQIGDTLLHGDYYPGSWLQTPQGIRIIDPEFCFYGPKEFDVAIMLAHCYMTGQDEDTLDVIRSSYTLYPSLDPQLLSAFIGVEIMRRLIGLAQVPLDCDLNRKEELLEKAYKLLTQ